MSIGASNPFRVNLRQARLKKSLPDPQICLTPAFPFLRRIPMESGTISAPVSQTVPLSINDLRPKLHHRHTAFVGHFVEPLTCCSSHCCVWIFDSSNVNPSAGF